MLLVAQHEILGPFILEWIYWHALASFAIFGFFECRDEMKGVGSRWREVFAIGLLRDVDVALLVEGIQWPGRI